MKEKIAVAGTGISGLSIARMLNNGAFDIDVLEKNEQVGGLIKCTLHDGNLFHRVGGHVFNSKNSKVLDWFWGHFDKGTEFLSATRNAKIFFEGKYIGYPIENYLYELPKETAHSIICDLLKISTQETAGNFDDFLLQNFGPTLYQLYFKPYNYKIWNRDLKTIPLEWLEGKLPMPNVENIMAQNILRTAETNMVHATFFYPVKGGSQFIVDRLSESLNITKNNPINSIKFLDGQLIINGNEQNKYRAIVYTGDVRKLEAIIQTSDASLKQVLAAVKTLEANGTTNVLCETDENDISWLYLPGKEFKAHRIIYTGNFSSTNNNTPTGRKTCVVEFCGKVDRQEVITELTKLPGNLMPIEFNQEPNSYIVHDHSTKAKVDALKAQLEPYNIFLLGRFAEWEYYNMDKCIEAAFLLTEKIHSLK